MQNAIIKARYYERQLGFKPIATEDSGLVIPSLNNEPGIYSSRYGSLNNDKERNDFLLSKMKNMKGNERKAHYESVIAFMDTDDTLYVFRGRCFGLISYSPVGNNGFGYDPLFYYPSLKKTFAEMSTFEKLNVSHRGNAISRLRKHILAKIHKRK